MKAIVFALLSVVLVSPSFAADARPVKKLVCKAGDGKIQGIVGIVVTPSDLEGQLIAMTTAKSGAVSFFASNGSVEDASIQVGAYRWPSNGDYTIRLNRSVDEKGNVLASLDETFVCDPSVDQEFCYGERINKTEKTATERLTCLRN